MCYSSMKNFFNACFIFFTCLFCTVFSISPCDLGTQYSKSQFRGKLSAMNRPLLQETVTTAVDVSLSINDVNIFDIKRLDLEIDLEMAQRWYDHRLAPDHKTRKFATQERIWKPKITFVVGNKNCPDTLAGNDETQFWRGTSNGSVFYSERFLVKPKCTADLSRYPFDSQTCFLKIGSYRFTDDEVSLMWNIEKPVELRGENELGEFRIKTLSTHNEIQTRSAGNFSVLVLEVQMTRYCRREILQSFTPSFGLVKIAYSATWTKSSDIRTRILTCQLSLFGILFLFTKSNYSTDQSNLTYLKALDIWFLMCLFFVLVPLAGSLIAFRYSNRSENDRSAEIECTDQSQSSASEKCGIMRMDKIFRILHPILLLSSTTLFFKIFNEGS